MADVTVTLPTLVADSAGWRSKVFEAETLADLLERLRHDEPVVAALVFDATGQPRQHVLVFHNDTATRWLDDLDIPVADGDRIDIVQAISGG
ncbi:MAG: MoaD/ThiS family protein [Planctomycetota bacterium]